jgi:predicted negative regulator of RcsB-dependent stress response
LVQAGRGSDAKASLDEGLALSRELKNDSLVSQLLRFQGDSASYGGDYKAARELYEQSLQSATRAKDAENILLGKLALARNDLQQGR